MALEWETTQSLQQGDNEYAPALVLHVWQGGGGAAEPPPPLQQHDSPAVAGSAAAAAEGQPGTPAAGASASRPTSRASSRRGGGTAGQADTSPAVQQTPGAATPPGAVRPSAGGLGGCVRRCAVMCNMRTPGDSDADSASDDDDEECTPGSDAGSGAGSVRSADGHGGRQLGGGAAPAAGSAVLQREWELLGELEYVLRLCMLEGREQAPHQEVTVRWVEWGGLVGSGRGASERAAAAARLHSCTAAPLAAACCFARLCAAQVGRHRGYTEQYMCTPPLSPPG